MREDNWLCTVGDCRWSISLSDPKNGRRIRNHLQETHGIGELVAAGDNGGNTDGE